MMDVEKMKCFVKYVTVRNMTKTVLTITEQQMNILESGDSATLLKALDIKPPRLIITLFSSVAFLEKSCSFIEALHNRNMQNIFPGHSELHHADLDEAEDNLHLFLKSSVLPLAIESQALVLVNTTDCLLTRIFSDLCQNIATTRGNQLPFAVLSITCNRYLRYAAMANDRSFTAAQLLDKSQELKHVSVNDKMADCAHGCTHYIICTTENKRVVHRFQHSLVQQLTMKLPSIAIGSLNGGLDYIADYLARNLPVLPLDTRKGSDNDGQQFVKVIEERAEKAAAASGGGKLSKKGTWDIYRRVFFKVIEQNLHTLTSKLAKKGTCDVYKRSSFAFIHQKLQQFDRLLLQKSRGRRSFYFIRPLYESINMLLKTASPVSKAESVQLVREALHKFRKHCATQKLMKMWFLVRHLQENVEELEYCNNEPALQDWLRKRSFEWSVTFGRMHPGNDWMKHACKGLVQTEKLKPHLNVVDAKEEKGGCKLSFMSFELAQNLKADGVQAVKPRGGGGSGRGSSSQ